MILNQGSYNFSAHPQVVAAKQKFKDPYSGKEMYSCVLSLVIMHLQISCTIEELFVGLLMLQ